MDHRLVERDVAICYGLGRMGIATGEDVARLHFAGRFSLVTARRRLRALTRLGLVRAFPPRNPSDPGWYALTPAGRAWLIGTHEVPAADVHAVSGVSQLNAPHARVASAVRVSFALAVRQTPSIELRAFVPERELRVASRAAGLAIVPDAFVVLAIEEREYGFALEVDLGHERHSVWRTKLRGYRALWNARVPLYGTAPWAVLVVVHAAAREQSIARLAAVEAAGEFVGVAVDGQVDEKSVLGSAWLRPADGARVRPLELASAWSAELTRRPDSTRSQGQERIRG